MTYDPASQGWSWTIDEDRAGKLSRFATLRLARATPTVPSGARAVDVVVPLPRLARSHA
ncbi:hypothetical protein AB5I41_14025 [Sphingomonas sp. MMS24-JH45]